MQLSDALILDARRRNADGYMKVRARSARVGVYDYLGAEVDPEGKRFKAGDIVKVYRPAEEVFATDSLASFVAKPITDNHPAVPVNSRNWKDHARGTVFGAVDEDGARNYVSFDLAFMDAALIDAIDSGKRELSNGYSCDLAFEDGTAPDGTRYQAVQRNIRGNHVAVVDRGRAGPECRVNDGFAVCDRAPHSIFDSLTTDGVADAKKWLKKAIALHKMHMNGSAPTTGAEGEKSQMLMMKQMENALAELDGSTSSKPMKMDHLNTDGAPTMKTILIDGLTVDVSNADTAMATITTLIAARDAATGKVGSLETQVATLTTDKATLEAKVKELTDAKPTPAQLRDAAKAYALVVEKAKAHGVAVTDAMDEASIIKATVLKHLGDSAESSKDWTDAQFASSFAMLKDANASTVQPLGSPVFANDAASVVSTIRNARYA